VSETAGARSQARVGAIDIGTNSVLLLIAESAGGTLEPKLERATITRLGEGVDRSRRLDPEATRRTLACLEAYAVELAKYPGTRLDVVGTSALRDAKGGGAFLDAAEQVLGVRPRVIRGSEEAELAFEGALSGLSLEGGVLVFDVGGGSTEVITGWLSRTAARAADRDEDWLDAKFQIEHAVSLEIGSVRLFERHVRSDPPGRDELDKVRSDIERALQVARRPRRGSALVGVAGTVTTLAAIELGLAEYDAARVHGHVLTRDSVFALCERLAKLSLAERRELPGLEPKRADVIGVGAEIVRGVMSWSGIEQVVVSDRGVRWGLAQRILRRTE
jgi:exopolyphosphatase/guanosine-5'-triphosphate,3'-diphosphate pyrophosphatase